MNKKMWAAVIVLVIVAACVWIFFGEQRKAVAPTMAVFDPARASYIIDGAAVAIGSAEGTTTIFGEPALGDLNGDGKPDAAVMIVQDPGGSGTFYYIAAAIDTPGGAVGTNAILLGDRIAPQTIAIQNGRIIVNYADRGPDQPMATPPSLGVTKYFIYQSSTLVEASSS